MKYELCPLERYSKISSLHINYAEGLIAVGAFDGRACIMEFDKANSGLGRSLITFKAQFTKTESSPTKLFYTSDIRFHPTQKDNILVCGDECSLIFYDFRKKTEHQKYKFGSPVCIARFSPDGKYVAYSLGNIWRKGLADLGSCDPRIFVHKVISKDLNNY